MKSNKLKHTCLIAVILLCTTGIAQASTAVVGQTSIFSSFESVAPSSVTPALGLALPNPGNASVVGNTAETALSASPGQAGEAKAYIGTSINWDYHGLNPVQANQIPVRLTVDYEYTISANWTPQTGSSNAGVGLLGFDNGWYNFFGYATGSTGTLNEHIVKTYTQDVVGNPLTVASFVGNPQLAFEVYSWAHSDISSINTSSAQIVLHSITVDTTPVPVPAAAWLFCSALAGLGVIGKRCPHKRIA